MRQQERPQRRVHVPPVEVADIFRVFAADKRILLRELVEDLLGVALRDNVALLRVEDTLVGRERLEHVNRVPGGVGLVEQIGLEDNLVV